MKAFRHVARLAALAAVALATPAPKAVAAPDVHRLNLVLSSNPTQLVAKDLNDLIDEVNRTALAPAGLEGLDKISNAWLHEASVRYFLRPNIAVNAGFGQIRSKSRREYLPRISESFVVRVDVISVPVHVGGAYYLQPYTQGDFQARAYFGGGFVSLTNNKVVFETSYTSTSSTTASVTDRVRGRRDGPGYYLEVGGHMWFASRYSVMLGALYRSAIIKDLQAEEEVFVGGHLIGQARAPGNLDLDVGGIGVRMALAIGF